MEVSIHAPRVGSDYADQSDTVLMMAFQSTLPAWGATRLKCLCEHKEWFQSTLPAWGATFSTWQATSSLNRFQSTLPAWGATVFFQVSLSTFSVSIHAPRVGSDDRTNTRLPSIRCFNPRSPRGERRAKDALHVLIPGFNPRSPRGERPRKLK